MRLSNRWTWTRGTQWLNRLVAKHKDNETMKPGRMKMMDPPNECLDHYPRRSGGRYLAAVFYPEKQGTKSNEQRPNFNDKIH